MNPDLEDGHIVRHVGTLIGTEFGGLFGMYTALRLAPHCGAAARTAACVEAAATCNSGSDAADDAGEAATQPDGGAIGDAPDVGQAPAPQARRQVSAKEKLQHDWQRVQHRVSKQMAEQVADDDPRCALLAAHMRQFDLTCQRVLATRMLEGGAGAAARSLQVNGAARGGWSLRRLKSCIQQAKRGNRQPYVQRAPLAAAGASPGKAPPLPFCRPPALMREPVMHPVSKQTEHQARKAGAASTAARAAGGKASRRKRRAAAEAQQENMAPGPISCSTLAATGAAAEPLGLHNMQQYLAAEDAAQSAAGDDRADQAQGHKRVRKAPAWQSDYASGEAC